jgi:hypothetical protein
MRTGPGVEQADQQQQGKQQVSQPPLRAIAKDAQRLLQALMGIPHAVGAHKQQDEGSGRLFHYAISLVGYKTGLRGSTASAGLWGAYSVSTFRFGRSLRSSARPASVTFVL